jgi:hypothetical protein
LNDSLQLKEEQEFVITSPPTRLSITDSQGTISDIDVMEQIQRVFPLMEGFTLQDIFLDPGRTFYLAGLALHLNNLETEAQLSFIRDIRRDPSTAIELFKQLSQQLDKHIKQSTHSKAFTMVDWSSLYQESLEQTINELTEAIRHEESVGLEDLRALPIDVIQGLYQICSIHLTPDGKDFYLQDRDQSPFPRHPQATSPGVLETINRYLGEDYTIFDLAVDPSLAIALTLTAFWIDYFDIGGNNIIQRITKDIFAKIRKLQDKELITPEQSSCILAATIELHQRIFGVSDGTSDEEAID